MTKVYRSRIDIRIGVVVAAVPLLLVFVLWKLFNESVPGRWVIALPIFLIGICLPISILFSTKYTIAGKLLRIRCGLFKWEIPINEISAIEPTNNPISSPALSLDRLHIEYGQGKYIMISPANKEEFLRDIEAIRTSMPRSPL